MPQKYSEKLPNEHVEPTMWEGGEYIGKDLDVKTPSTSHAAREAIKYGDKKTASVAGRGSEAMAAIVDSFKAAKKRHHGKGKSGKR